MALTLALGVELLNVAGESLVLAEEDGGKREGALPVAVGAGVRPSSELSSPARASRSASISMIAEVRERLAFVVCSFEDEACFVSLE